MPTDDLKSLLSEARRIMSALKAIEKNGTKVAVVISGLKSQIADFESKKKKVSKLCIEIDGQAEKIEERLEKTRSFISDAQNIHTKIGGILKSSEAKSQDATTRHEAIKNASEAIKKIKVGIERQSRETERNSANILQILEQAKVNKEAGAAFLRQLEQVTKYAEAEQKELADILINGKKDLAAIKSAKEQSEKLHGETKGLHKKVSDYCSEIFSDSGTKKRLSEIEDKIKSAQSLIDEQLGTSTSGRLCGEIRIHKDDLRKTLDNWKLTVFISAVFTLLINVLPILDIGNIKVGGEMLGLELSVLFILVFSTIQYASTKKQYEEYSFKYISAFSLPAYLELISDRNEEKAAEFLEKTISDIYKKPDGNGRESIIDYIFELIKPVSLDPEKMIRNLTEDKIDEGAAYIKSLIK